MLVEGGSQLFSDFLRHAFVDRLLIFVAPKLLGGGVPAVKQSGEALLKNAPAFRFTDVRMIGPDLLIEAVPHKDS